MNEAAPVTVRVNRTKTSRDALLPELRTRFPEAVACRYSPDGIVLGRRGDVGQDPAFLAGLISPQDEASQLVVHWLDPRPGERILDVCAAPGTKTAAIAERMAGQGQVLALDRHERRLGLVGRGRGASSSTGVATLERDATKSLADLARARSAPSTASSSTPPAPGSARCAAIPTRAGACAPKTSSSSRGRSARCSNPPPPS